MMKEYVLVEKKALATIVYALNGPPHYMLEITMTRSIAHITGDDPIDELEKALRRDVILKELK